MTSTFRGGGGLRQKQNVLGRRGGGCVSECSGRPIFIYFIKENWVCAMTRHHAEPNINIIDKKSSFSCSLTDITSSYKK